MSMILELESVTAAYGSEVVLRNVNLTIREKDFIGIIGPNGGGKTTLLKIILGELPPVSGRVLYNPQYIANRQHIIGYLPQRHQFDNKFPITVMDVVLSGLLSRDKFFRRFTKTERQKAIEWLEWTGIAGLKDKNIGQLSGGQAQRVFLCRSLISEPMLLLLDEPDTYVDNTFESDLYRMLTELNTRMAIITVSHDIGTIAAYIKTIACVNRTLHYHPSNIITEEQLASYDCPIQIISHGNIPHTILKKHD
ncbi:MAG: ABC transporter ATP-binding protein [Bacteroidetes bacterium]|nr:ABC transporter ATP-binding protein [Bacteroidota bacterium]